MLFDVDVGHLGAKVNRRAPIALKVLDMSTEFPMNHNNVPLTTPDRPKLQSAKYRPILGISARHGILCRFQIITNIQTCRLPRLSRPQ